MEAAFCGEWGQKTSGSATDPFLWPWASYFINFFLIPNYLLLPFFFSLLAYFVCLDCLVLRDYLFFCMHSSQHGTPFSIAAAVNSHSVRLGGPGEGKQELEVCVCFVLWKCMHFWMSACDFFSVLSCVRGSDKREPKHGCGKLRADAYLCRWARTKSLHL